MLLFAVEDAAVFLFVPFDLTTSQVRVRLLTLRGPRRSLSHSKEY